jgi:CRP-like cAMP-binding protein
METKVVKKNDYLLKQGDTCKDLVFVQKGCLRLYYLKGVWLKMIAEIAVNLSLF